MRSLPTVLVICSVLSACGDSNESGSSNGGAGAGASGGASGSGGMGGAGGSGGNAGGGGGAPSDPVDLAAGSRTMLFSHTESFCEGTETSSPYAYVEFAYVESGALKVLHTRTACDDPPPEQAGRILGEPVTFQSPDVVIRADGTSYPVESGTPSAVGYGLDRALLFVSNADDAALITNDHPDEYIAECESLEVTLEREVCLLWQVQLAVLDPSACDAFTEVPVNLCRPYTQP